LSHSQYKIAFLIKLNLAVDFYNFLKSIAERKNHPL